MSPKQFKHFAKRETVLQLIEEIKKRHKQGYTQLANSIIAQIKNYFQNQFPSADPTAGRSCFRK